MQRVSSNLTIFFKLFIPTVWIVFFTTFTLVLFLIDPQSLPFLTSPVFKYPFLGLYIIFFLILYFTVIQLWRVEMGMDFYTATNYFKTYRLSYEDIERIQTIPLGRLKVITFRLKAKGSFGNKITFLASTQLLDIFLNSQPQVKEKFNYLIM